MASDCQLHGVSGWFPHLFNLQNTQYFFFLQVWGIYRCLRPWLDRIAAECRTPHYQPTPLAVRASSLSSPTAPGCVCSSATNSPRSVKGLPHGDGGGKSKYLQSKVA